MFFFRFKMTFLVCHKRLHSYMQIRIYHNKSPVSLVRQILFLGFYTYDDLKLISVFHRPANNYRNEGGSVLASIAGDLGFDPQLC